MKWSFGAIVGGVALAAITTPAFGAVDAYLQIEGVKGESLTKPGAIEVTSFQWGVGRGISSPTGGASDRKAGAPGVRSITITKAVDKASPLFTKCMAAGCHYQKALLYVRKAGERPQDYLQYTLTDVTISSYHVNSGGDRPSESLTLNFAKIEMQYEKQKGQGEKPGVAGPMAPSSNRLPPPGPGH